MLREDADVRYGSTITDQKLIVICNGRSCWNVSIKIEWFIWMGLCKYELIYAPVMLKWFPDKC